MRMRVWRGKMRVESENGSSERKIESGSLWMSLIENGNLKRFFVKGYVGVHFPLFYIRNKNVPIIQSKK